MSRELDHLRQLHEMCTKELQLLVDSSFDFLESSKRILGIVESKWKHINNNDAVALIAYDNFLTCLSSIMDLSRKFNLYLKLNDVGTNSSSALYKAMEQLPITESSVKNGHKKQNNSNNKVAKNKWENSNAGDFSKYSLLPAEVNEENDSCSNVSDAAEMPAYVNKDISIYEPGCVIQMSITHVLDTKALHFYACDVDSPDISSLQHLSKLINLRQYIGLPKENEVFGLVLDDIILRAIRIDNNEFADTTQNSDEQLEYTVFLLDLGEVVQMGVKDIAYHLQIEQQKLPAQAMLCQLHDNTALKSDTKTLQQKLKAMEYEKVSLCVIANESGKLHMALMEEEKEPKVLTNTNPFIDDNIDALPALACVKLTTALDEPTQRALPNGLTADEYEMLQEDPSSTTNVMKAVLGYDPKDDRRICRFYDPKIGGCFKGVNCRQDHVLTQAEGWTKDVVPAATIIDNRAPLIRYARNTNLNITATHVAYVDRFYAHVNDEKNPHAPLIWNPEDIPATQHLKQAPLVYDLVLARYEDGLWYRAKIIEADESRKVFKVFYVDYGNEQLLPLKDLARCDYATAQLPFQAIICRMVGVRDATEEPEQRKRAITIICDLILNQTFDVKVIHHHDDLLVKFMDKRYEQVKQTLINMGCMKPFKTIAV